MIKNRALQLKCTFFKINKYNYLRDFVMPFMTNMSVIFEAYHIVSFRKLITNSELCYKTGVITAFLKKKRERVFSKQN